MNPDEAQDNFINFIEKDNYQNGILILKGMLAMKQELQRNSGFQGYEKLENWSWMKKNTVYLVTNGSGLFLINNFGIDDRFYYWRLSDLNWREGTDLKVLVNMLEVEPVLKSLLTAPLQDWLRFVGWKRFEREWWLSSPQSNVWVKGPIIPIIPIPSSMMDGFMNWTKNPLED